MPRPDLVKASLRDFLLDEAEELVRDLVVDGEEKQIGQISTSRLTMAEVPDYQIGITCIRWESVLNANVPGNSSIAHLQAKKTERATYDVELEIQGVALVRGEEGADPDKQAQEFETDHALFDKFVARVIQYLTRDNASIPATGGGTYTIEVVPKDGRENDRRVDGEDRSGWYQLGTGDPIGLLWNVVRFQVETCGEPSPAA